MLWVARCDHDSYKAVMPAIHISSLREVSHRRIPHRLGQYSPKHIITVAAERSAVLQHVGVPYKKEKKIIDFLLHIASLPVMWIKS